MQRRRLFWSLGLMVVLLAPQVGAQAREDAAGQEAAETVPASEPGAQPTTPGATVEAGASVEASTDSPSGTEAATDSSSTGSSVTPPAVEPTPAAPWERYRPRAGELELGLLLGVLHPSSSHNFHDEYKEHLDLRSAPLFGLDAGFFPLPWLGAEVQAAIAPTSTADDSAAQIWTLRGELVGQLPFYRVVPYLTLGGGRMGAFSDELGSDGDPMLCWGLGGKFGVSDLMSVRLDFRDNLTQKNRADEGSLTHHVEVSLGVAVRIATFGQGQQ